MKCIDAIEGNVKLILNQLHKSYIDQQLDDSEYIRNVKSVLDATDQYAQKNPEIVESPQMLQHVLYVYSRNLWLMGQHPISSPLETNDVDNEDYQTYYYDFLYDRGVYPS
jgi:gamma-glutamyl:cysteine ligase YbdK (ATP-grasp superfamily)